MITGTGLGRSQDFGGRSLAAPTVLEIRDLVVEFATQHQVVRAVDGVSLELRSGETLALIGESGSGKTTVALAAVRLLPPRVGYVRSGSVRLHEVDMLGLSRRELRRILGRRIAIIFQDSAASLNPFMRVGDQISEAIRAHARVSRGEAASRAISLLAKVGVADPVRRARQYPHQLSGGIRQRVMIATAMCNQPSILIADEATTALDVTIQAQVLEALRAALAETGAAMLLITHDLGVVAEIADRVAVMYAGRIVEAGLVDDIFHRPRHPYTIGLLASQPAITYRQERLTAIPGQPLGAADPGDRCSFASRCFLRNQRLICLESRPALVEVSSGHESACHFHSELAGS